GIRDWSVTGVQTCALPICRGGVADRAALTIGLVGISIPDFWLGIMLILGVSLGLGLLPSGGFVPLGEAPIDNLLHLVLPALTLEIGRASCRERGWMSQGAG